jgi:hypothetical protein
LYDLKQSVVSLPPSSTLTFSSNYGGETSIYEGFEASLNTRPRPGAFVQVGVGAQKHIFDQCNLVNAGIKSAVIDALTEVAEIFPDGTKACHQELPYRPDLKLLGSYSLPLGVQVSATFQFSRGVQNGTIGGNSILATWSATPESATTLGRPYSAGLTTKSVNLIANGANYGTENLNQLDLSVSKRIKINKVGFRVNIDAYNLFNSDWPFAVTNTFSTAATSAYLRPTNVLQSRFVKIGAQFDF